MDPAPLVDVLGDVWRGRGAERGVGVRGHQGGGGGPGPVRPRRQTPGQGHHAMWSPQLWPAATRCAEVSSGGRIMELENSEWIVCLKLSRGCCPMSWPRNDLVTNPSDPSHQPPALPAATQSCLSPISRHRTSTRTRYKFSLGTFFLSPTKLHCIDRTFFLTYGPEFWTLHQRSG